VTLDTNGNIFGGFTPVEWDCSGKHKVDPSLKSFLFTLKNPHNIPARTFALRHRKLPEAIVCDCGAGPRFWDIGVYADCNANTNSFTGSLGSWYINDTGRKWDSIFTGNNNFRGKEIEVFEITD
jgi:hypothetical protein